MSRGAAQDDLQRPLPTSTMLSFCEKSTDKRKKKKHPTKTVGTGLRPVLLVPISYGVREKKKLLAKIALCKTHEM